MTLCREIHVETWYHVELHEHHCYQNHLHRTIIYRGPMWYKKNDGGYFQDNLYKHPWHKRQYESKPNGYIPALLPKILGLQSINKHPRVTSTNEWTPFVLFSGFFFPQQFFSFFVPDISSFLFSGHRQYSINVNTYFIIQNLRAILQPWITTPAIFS